jgi:hypothetical protein
MSFNFIRKWLRPPVIDNFEHEPKNCGRCYTGVSNYYATYDTLYRYVTILDKCEQSVERCGFIPELTEWCVENNCIYGWSSIITTDRNQISYSNDYKLFIATKDLDTYTTIKLTWL